MLVQLEGAVTKNIVVNEKGLALAKIKFRLPAAVVGTTVASSAVRHHHCLAGRAPGSGSRGAWVRPSARMPLAPTPSPSLLAMSTSS